MVSGKEITREIKNQIIEYYKNNIISISTLSKIFNISAPTAIKILKDIPKHPKSKVQNPNMNEDYFENIDNEYKAYYLGWILTDGNIFKFEGNNYCPTAQAKISLYIKEEDKYILDAFKEQVGVNTLITNDNRGCCVFKMHSNKMAEDLSKFGIVPKKSQLTYLPKIDEKLMPHFIRGIFDGDGCIYIKNCRGTKRNNYLKYCNSHTVLCYSKAKLLII